MSTTAQISVQTGYRKKLVLWLVAAAAAALWIALLWTHAHARRPWNDEALLGTPGMMLIETGHLGTPVIEDAKVPAVHRYTYWVFPFFLLATALWYKIVGFSLFTLRAFSILSSAVLLYVIFRFARKLTGSLSVGILAVVLTGFQYDIMVSGSFGRYDPFVAALGFGAYLTYLLLREKNLRLALLASQTLIAACGMTHPNGLMFLFGSIFLVLYYDRRSLRLGDLAVCALPYLIGGALWGAYILKDPQAAIAQLKTQASDHWGLFTPLQTVHAEVTRYLEAAGLTSLHSGGSSGPIALKAIAWVVLFSGVAYAALTPEIRSRAGVGLLLRLTLLHFLYQCFFDGTKFPFYLEHIIPLYAILLAVSLDYAWRRGRIPKLVLAGAAGAVVLIGIAGVAQRIRINTYRNLYEPAVEFIQHNASPTDMVMASCDFGFGYGFAPNLIDDIRLGFFSGKTPEFIVVEESYEYNFVIWKVTHPDVYQFIQNRLRTYQLVYDHNTYRIYKRPAAVAGDAAGVRR